MIDHKEFARDLHLEMTRLDVFIDRGWISPLIVDGRPFFRDIDLARAELIADLANEMGINDEGIDVVLNLLDQLYSLRFACSKLFDALEDQPPSIRRRVVTDAQNLKRPARPGSHALR